MSGLPLDETALRAASETYDDETLFYTTDREDREEAMRNAISTYLREAKFKLEKQHATMSAKHGLSDPEQRLVGPWVPVVQAESEEE
jgi:hypothetical protein